MKDTDMDRSGGGGATWHASRASIVFFSRPESGVTCMTDDGFVRVVGDEGKGKEEKRRRKKFVIGEKIIRIIFDQSTTLPNFLRARKKIFSFVSLPSHWPRLPPYAPWPKFDSDFHSENGHWDFVGRPSGTKKLLVALPGQK
jgi:hypothetical protein